MPQLIETEDFVEFKVSTLNGAAAQKKGMALFPRRIGGKYVMLSRSDRENLHHSIGAMLLDLEDPRQLKGHLARLLIEPEEDEREGYVPNVVYTCGAIARGNELIVPYGFADCGVAIARVPLADLLVALCE